MATVKTIGDAVLANSIINKSITEIEDEMCGSVGKRAFINCSVLEKADFSDAQRIKEEAFRGCSSLNALILRKNSVCTFENNALADTPIANGDGYIYVPAEKVDATKGNCVYPDKVRAIEDYPAVCSDLGKVWTRGSGQTWDTGKKIDDVWLLYGSSSALFANTDYKKLIASASLQSSTGMGQKVMDVAYGDGLWVAVRGNNTYGIWTSSNYKSGWECVAGTETLQFYSVAYHDGMWVVGGYNADTGMWYSEDGGLTWTKSDTGTGGSVSRIAYHNGVWVVGGYRVSLHYSTDGKTWQQVQGATDSIEAKFIKYVGDKWVANGPYSNTLMSSLDGITWTRTSISPAIGTVRDINYDAGIWVLATESGLYYSTDGTSWAASNMTGKYTSIVYTNGLWVAAGSAVYICYSTNGKTWTNTDMWMNNDAKLIAAESVMLCVQYNGIAYSTAQ